MKVEWDQVKEDYAAKDLEINSLKERIKFLEGMQSNKKLTITATISGCVQTGVDTYVDRKTSRSYDESAKISEIIEWAKSALNRDYISICDIQFSDNC